MFQIFLAVILILAVSYQYDVPKEPGLLPTPPRTLPSHSSTCLQVEDSKNKQFTFQLCETLWVEGLGYTSEQDKFNPIIQIKDQHRTKPMEILRKYQQLK